jgi:hypothetical protein
LLFLSEAEDYIRISTHFKPLSIGSFPSQGLCTVRSFTRSTNRAHSNPDQAVGSLAAPSLAAAAALESKDVSSGWTRVRNSTGIRKARDSSHRARLVFDRSVRVSLRAFEQPKHTLVNSCPICVGCRLFYAKVGHIICEFCVLQLHGDVRRQRDRRIQRRVRDVARIRTDDLQDFPDALSMANS